MNSYPTMSHALVAEANRVIEHGYPAGPRGLGTLELLGEYFVIEDAVRYGLPIKCGRKLNTTLAAIEGAQNLAGASFPDVAIAIAPALERFADIAEDGSTYFFQGAYSARLGDQMIEVEHQLRADPETRQAVVSMWQESDRDPQWRDRPCTTELQWLQRDGSLYHFTYMRSNDAWKGFSYDVFQFGQLQAMLAHVLEADVGSHHHFAASFHLYDEEIERALNLELEDGAATQHFSAAGGAQWPSLVAGPPWWELGRQEYGEVQEVQDRFIQMLTAKREQLQSKEDELGVFSLFEARNPVEAWYCDKLKVPHVYGGLISVTA